MIFNSKLLVFISFLLLSFTMFFCVNEVKAESKFEIVSKKFKKNVNKNPAYALKIATELIEITENEESQTNYLKALMAKGFAYENLSELDSAEAYYSLAVTKADNRVSDSIPFYAYNYLAIINIKQYRYDEGLAYLDSAEQIAQQINMYPDIIDIKKNKAMLYSKKNKYSEALDQYQGIYALAYDKNDSAGVAFSLEQIAFYNRMLSMDDKAEEYYNESFEYYYDLQNVRGMSRALGSLGNMFYENKNYDAALGYYKRVLNLSIKFKLRKMEAAIRNNIGLVYKGMLRYEDALESCKLSLHIKEDMNDPTVHYQLTSIAEIYLLNRQYDSAAHYLSLARKLSEEPDAIEYRKDVDFLYYRYFNKRGNDTEALKFYIDYSKGRDTLLSRSTQEKIVEQQIRFGTKKREQENKLITDRHDAQVRLNLMQRVSFIIVGSLISILALTSYFRYWQKKRRVIMLETKNEKIHEQHYGLELVHRNLRKQARVLTDSLSIKDKFFAIIAHDLKNPLHAIILSSDTLLDKFDDPFLDPKKIVENIHHAGRHLSQLLENLLQWSRAQTGRIPFEPVSIDLYSFVNSNAALYKHNAETKYVTINNIIPPELKAHADPNMLNTVLRNLLSNAIKYSNIGGRIDVGIVSSSPMIEVYIRDYGIGISATDIEKLFRLDIHHTTYGTKKEKGTGLGLILCKEFVEINGGNIRVWSKLGQGTTFAFTLKKHA